MMRDETRLRQRWRRRIIAIGVFLLAAFCLSWFFEAQDTTTVIFVRYADIVDSDEPNPGLSPAGHRRAAELARVLGEIQNNRVDAIFATQFRHTQETAEPLAKLLEKPVQVVDSNDVRGLRDLVREDYKGKIVLIITDRDAMTRLITRFRGKRKIPPIADTEYDNMYMVIIPWYGKVKTLRLKYGSPYRS